MPSSGMVCLVAFVKTDVLEEHSTSIIRVTIISELGSDTHCIVFFHSVCWLLVTANIPSSQILVTLMMEVPRSSETSVLIRAT
jgi:hypothetical protein